MYEFTILAGAAVKGSWCWPWQQRRPGCLRRALGGGAASGVDGGGGGAAGAAVLCRRRCRCLRVPGGSRQGRWRFSGVSEAGRGDRGPTAATASLHRRQARRRPLGRLGRVRANGPSPHLGGRRVLRPAADVFAARRWPFAARRADDRAPACAESARDRASGRCDRRTRYGMPMTFGVFRPAVMLPAGASEWSPRAAAGGAAVTSWRTCGAGDVATHLLARTAVALYWWNPLAWFAWREFLKERERATDDLVLQAGERASDYAAHLLEVARTLAARRRRRHGRQSRWRGASELEGRLVAILDTGVSRRASGRRAQVAAVAGGDSDGGAVGGNAGAGSRDSAGGRSDRPRGQCAEESRDPRPRRRRRTRRSRSSTSRKKMLESSLTIREQVGQRGLCGRPGEARATWRRSAASRLRRTRSMPRPSRWATGRRSAPALVHLGAASDRHAVTAPSAENYFQRVLERRERRVRTRARR